MLATLACLLVTQSAQTDIPALLRRDVTHASSHTYFMSYNMEMDMAGVPGAEAFANQPMTTTATYREVLTPIGGGKAKVKITVSNMQVQSPLLQGQKIPTEPVTVTMTVDALNRVAFDKNSMLTKSASGAALFGGSNPFGMSSAFPEKPVRYGDSWPMTFTGGGGFMDLAELGKVEVTYLGDETVNGVPCWRTQLGIDMDLGQLIGKVSEALKAAGSEAPSGSMSVTGYNLYSKADGGLIHSYGSGSGAIDVSAKGQSIKMKMKFSMELKRLS